MQAQFDMDILTYVFDNEKECTFLNVTVWVKHDDGETIITDTNPDSPSIILKCYIDLHGNCYDLKDFLRAYRLEVTKYTRIVAFHGKYEPTVKILRLCVEDISYVVSKTNEEGNIYFLNEPLNLCPPQFGKKRKFPKNDSPAQPPNKKQKTYNLANQKSFVVNNNGNNTNNNNNMRLTPLPKKPLNNNINIDDKPIRPPLPSLDVSNQNTNHYSSVSTETSINVTDNTIYSDSESDDDFESFIHKAKVKKHKINDEKIGINGKQRILIKNISSIFISNDKPWVNKYYIIANLIATKNIFIDGCYRGFKLIFQCVDGELITLVSWNKNKTAVNQFVINTIYIVHTFMLRQKDRKQQQYNPDTNRYILMKYVKTRIFPLYGSCADFNIPSHFSFKCTKLSLDNEEKVISLKKIVTYLFNYPAIIDNLNGKMIINKSGIITPTGINVMGIISDYKYTQSNNKIQLDLVLQYKQFAIHVVVWSFNETYVIKKHQIVAIINGVLSLRTNGFTSKLQIKIGPASLLIFNPWNEQLTPKLEQFKKSCLKYYTLKETAIQSKYKIAKYKNAAFEEISSIAGRPELVNDFYFHCSDILLISSIDFGDARCPFTLYSRTRNSFVTASEKTLSLKTRGGFDVKFEELTITWNVHFRLKNEMKPEIDVVRGKCHSNLINNFYKENKNIRKLFFEWRQNANKFIKGLELLFINIEITNLLCVFERRKGGYSTIFYDAKRV